MRTLIIHLVFIILITDLYSQFEYDGECGFTKSLIDRVYLGKIAERRPILTNEQIINTEHFKIHYTLFGDDATTQEWAESTASIAEYCWNFFSSQKWALPPPDFNMGCDNKYDIYIYNLGTAFHGVTYAESLYNNPYPDGKTSWIAIRRDSLPRPLSKWDGLRSLISHELAHAVQARYSGVENTFDGIPDSSANNWFYENCAVYIEDIIYDDVNSLWKSRFIEWYDPLDHPELPISSNLNYYQYCGALWPTFLHEKYNDTIVRKIWEKLGQIAGQNLYSGMENSLRIYANSSLNEALRIYAIWRFFTGNHADSLHFEEAYNYPTCVYREGFSSNWSTGELPLPSGPGGMSAIMGIFRPPVAIVNFNGQDNFRWAASAVSFRWDSITSEYNIPLNQFAEGSLPVPRIGGSIEYEGLVLIPVVIDTSVSANNLTYVYKVEKLEDAVIKMTNKINDTNLGGKLLIFPSDTVNSGSWRIFSLNTPYTIKTLNERFNLPSCIYKHHNWNRDFSKYKLSKVLITKPYQEENAMFDSLRIITICNSLISAPNQNFGAVQFKDPWYLHSDNTQPNSFIQYTSPHSPTGAYNQTTGGVFLNQGNPPYWQPPYYSVRVPRMQRFGIINQSSI
ncbi:MAG: hypothetical protein N2169_07210 [bacterium]|nr:hypothetical protein [bacterium]